MNKLKILVVDDEERMRKLVKDFLERKNYEIIEAKDGVDAIEKFSKDKSIKLVIMDLMMPNMDGLEASKIIREESNIPILMLTAKDSEEDELKGFEIGADEYITKPFSPKILTARVDALLKRHYIDENAEEILIAGDITINITKHIVTVNNEVIDLSFKEFELLTYFVRNKNIALSREKILSKVWDYDYFGDARTIDTHVKKLRQKIGPVCGEYIKTIWGLGYKFEID